MIIYRKGVELKIQITLDIDKSKQPTNASKDSQWWLDSVKGILEIGNGHSVTEIREV